MESKKRSIIIALMVAMFLAAVEGTVVTTAVPTIVKDLKGLDLISLVFSVYLLTSAISTPIYGKLSDLFGRKIMLTIGIIIFLLGSFLCALSHSMFMLISFRAVQGLGAGAIFTITYTIVGDIFTIEERAKVQGIISTVWGVASLAGPFLGGLLINTLSWHWIFFINIPFGILSVIMLQKSLKETFEKKKHKIDFAGIITLSLAMIIFLNIFLSTGNMGLNHNLFIIMSIGITAFLLWVFYIVERKAKEPIIPFNIFTKFNIIVNIISFFIAGILIGIDVYIQIYIQDVLGFNALIAGLAMAPMSLAWLISSVILGKYIVRYGEKFVIVASNIIILISALLLVILNTNSSLLLVIVFVFIMGFGFGGAFTTLTIVVQSSVGFNKRGAAIATNSLLRTLGQTIGVSILGSIFNLFIGKYFSDIGISGINSGNLLEASNYSTSVTSEQIKLSLNGSVHIVMVILIILSAFCLLLSLVMPKRESEQEDAIN